MDPERRSQRYPSNEPVQVRCETWREFVDTYANDICRGGMFVRTNLAPEVLSNVELRLTLPEGTQIELTARVVHVVTAEQAEQYNQVAGIGVEFVHADAEQKRQILQLVEFARSQGDNADPNASWTRTLLESSDALATRDVAARLSMLPDATGKKPSRPNLPAAPSGAAANDGSAPAVRPRGQSVPIDPQVMAAASARVASASGTIRAPTTPVTGRSSATMPAVRAQTQPITGRSSATMPAVRPQTGPTAGATTRSTAHMPAVRAPTGPVSANPSQPTARAASGPISGAPGQPNSSNPQPGSPSGAAPSPSGQPAAPPKPTDIQRLKLVLNSLAHKHYDDAARLAREMLVDNPGDPQVLKWQAICFARVAITRNDPAGAAEQYLKALAYDENNREARDYVKTFQREQKLNSLPFGRYFMKKK